MIDERRDMVATTPSPNVAGGPVVEVAGVWKRFGSTES